MYAQAYMSSERQGRVLTGKMMDKMYTFAPRPLVSHVCIIGASCVVMHT